MDSTNDGLILSPAFKISRTFLLDQTLINEARQVKIQSVLSKRALPGDLVVASNGWGAITYPKKLFTAQDARDLSALQIHEIHIKMRVRPNIVYRNDYNL